jgi:hypothetical protein
MMRDIIAVASMMLPLFRMYGTRDHDIIDAEDYMGFKQSPAHVWHAIHCS